MVYKFGLYGEKRRDEKNFTGNGGKFLFIENNAIFATESF